MKKSKFTEAQILKVQKKHPHMGASKIRRVYEKEGFSLYKRIHQRQSVLSVLALSLTMLFF